MKLDLHYQDVQCFFFFAAILILIAVMCCMLWKRRTYKNICRKRKTEWMALTAVSVAFLLIMAGLSVKDYSQAQIVINEICSNNESYALDENGQITDYIELYNTGGLVCETSGLYLSDDPYNLKKISLSGQSIPAYGVVVVPCMEDGNSFSIDQNGESIFLSNENGIILERIDVVDLEEDMSYVRIADSKEWQIRYCTPANADNMSGQVSVEMPILSHVSGFYDTTFELEIASGEDTVVYYTLDGSVPDEGSYIYEEPISVYDKSAEPNVWKSWQNIIPDWQEYTPDETTVQKAFLIRAVAMDRVGNKSDVVTATYFVGLDDFKDKDVISLIAEPEDLFGDEKGIYVTGTAYDEWYLNGQEGDKPVANFRQKGREWEREAVMELFDSGVSEFQQDVGIRIQGASARDSGRKRFSIYARKEYSGSALLDQPLFGNELQSHSVVLRDTIADVLCQCLMNDRGIPYQQYRRVSLFLNGEYWYDSFIREKYDDQYFSDHYGINEGNLIVIEGNAVSCGVETDMVQFGELYRYIEENDFTDEQTFAELETIIDVQSYIDFLITNIYCSNMDIDLENTKNVVMWRSREIGDGEYSDGKWRFALYDMDAVQWNSLEYYGIEERAALNSFSQQPEHADRAYNQGVLYAALKKNENFCRQFVQTFMDLLNTNFSVAMVNEKFGTAGKNSTWLDSYFEKRPDYMKKYLAEEFGLTGSIETVTLCNPDESKGTITLNTITPSMKDGNWIGEYFTDYPVAVTVNPAEGYEFTGWSGSIVSDEKTIEVPVTAGGIELKAEFRKVR